MLTGVPESSQPPRHETGKRRLRRTLVGLAVCLVLLAAPSVAAAADAGRWPSLQEIQAKAWIVVDARTGDILIEYNADEPLYPASTTKILTAVIALESDDLDRTVQVSADAVKLPAGSSKVGYLAGETVVLRDVLFGMMLASGNDAANVLAEALAGSQPAFADLMNARAAEIGLKNSHFMNPSGLQDPNHYVTARDMARLASYAMQNADFCNLTATRSYSLPPSNLHPFYGWAVLNNTNRLLQFGDTFYKSDFLASISGIKTGSTNDAGNNLITVAESISGRQLISVLMGVPFVCPDGLNMFSFSRTLLEEAARIGANPTESSAETTPAGTGATTESSRPATDETTSTVLPTPAGTSDGQPTEPNGTSDPADKTAAQWRREAANWRASSFILLILLLVSLLVWINMAKSRRNRGRIRARRVR